MLYEFINQILIIIECLYIGGSDAEVPKEKTHREIGRAINKGGIIVPY